MSGHIVIALILACAFALACGGQRAGSDRTVAGQLGGISGATGGTGPTATDNPVAKGVVAEIEVLAGLLAAVMVVKADHAPGDFQWVYLSRGFHARQHPELMLALVAPSGAVAADYPK